MRVLQAVVLSILTLVLAMGAASHAFAAEMSLIPRADLFGNPTRIASQISPDGMRISWLAPVNGVMNLWVAPKDNLDAAHPVTEEKTRGITNSSWSYDGHHLLYVQDKNGNANLHLYAVDLDTSTTRDLTPFENVRATIAAVSPRIPGEVLISLNKRDPKFADLYRVDLATGAMTMVTENPGFLSFLATDHYVPTLGLKLNSSGGEDVLRFENGQWKNWLEISAEDARTTSFLAVDSMGRSVFALDSRNRNTMALVRIDLESGSETVLAQDPRGDIRDVIVDQNTQEPIAYAVNTARLEHRAISPAFKADIDFLSKQNLGDWMLNSRSMDDRYWKLASLTDLQLSAVLYDRKTRGIAKLYDTRPQLLSAPLVHMHPVTIKARDGLDLTAYLSIPKDRDVRETGIPDHPVPLVVVVHGGPHDRDTYGFNPIHQWLANRGYAALSVNYRGSTGFGKSFVNASVLQWGAKMDDDVLDAVAWAIKAKIVDPQRIAIMGGSYGGYETLVGMTRDADTYACGIDLYGLADMPAVGPSQAAYLTAGGAMYFNELGDQNTEVGRALSKERSPVTHMNQIKHPLLVAQGANDRFVLRLHSDEVVAGAKANDTPVTYLLYPDEGHGFVRPENNLSFYAVAEQFLSQCLGGRAEPLTGDSLKGSSIQVLEGADRISGLQLALAAPSEVAGPQPR